jgi:hypothetical protein
MGLPTIAGHFMFKLLKSMHFRLVMGFGTSSNGFNNTSNDITGQGVLQGSSSAAPIFLLNSDVSLSAYKKLGTGASFSHPISGKSITKHVVQFVDDTSQFLNMSGIQQSTSTQSNISDSLAKYASTNAQLWSDLLWTSGGDN